MSGADSGTQLLSDLAHEFVERLRRGDKPTVEQLAAEHPELADDIRDLFPALQWMEGIDPSATPSAACHETSDDDCQYPWQLGEYRILRRIGRGGMGTVYEAVQESLGRHVAIKVLSPRDAKNATLIERFKREAQAAAHLHHTNIVPVFGVGESAGMVYYAMQLIQGEPLDRVLANDPLGQHEARLTSFRAVDDDYYRAVARLSAQAAAALAYAHGEGVLHRDIKPANLLLDAQGTLWITDFGLAQIEGLSELTVAEDVIGTLRYVPPERFEGRTDARGDVYSLGLTLYELLIRRPAFGSVSRAELVRRILHESPPTPRSIDHLVPRDLETIVMKAISREPDRRYSTAAAMAEDLRRFCADRPILARRTTVFERFGRWCRKSPLEALASSLAVLLLLFVAVGSTFAYFRESGLRGNLAVALQRAEKAELQGRNELFTSYVATAHASRLSQRQGQRLDSLAALHKATQMLTQLDLPPAELDRRRAELRDLAITCLALPDIRDVGDLGEEGGILNFFHFDQSARRDNAGALIVNQWPNGTELFRLPDVNEHTLFEFTSNRDEMLLIDQQTDTLNRWQFGDAAPTLVAHLGEHTGSLTSYELSRDARRLLLIRESESSCQIEVVDWPSGRHRTNRKLPYLTGIYPAARLSPDGRMLAIIGGDYRSDEARLVTVTDVDSGAELATLEHAASVSSVAWHPDSQTLAVGLTDSNDILLWNVPQKKQVGKLDDQRGGGPWLCMNSTGELLCSCSTWVQRVDIWHPYLGKRLLKMPGALLFNWNTNDGRLIGETRQTSGGWHYVAAEPSPVVRTLARNPVYGPVEAWRDVSVHPRGRLLAVGSDNGVSLFDLQTGRDIGLLPVGYALHPWFIPATGDLLTYSKQGLLRWPVTFRETDPPEASIGLPQKLPCTAAFGTQVHSDNSGQVIAVATGKTAVILHDFGKRVIVLDPQGDCRKVAVSPNGRWVVTGCDDDGALNIWDADSGALVRQLDAIQAETNICFTPDSQFMSFHRFEPRLIHAETWQEQAVPEAPGIGFTSFSADGRLAIDLHAAGATLREFPMGRKLGTLALPDSPAFWYARFTPDGRRVILNSNDQHATYVWDLSQLSRELAAIELGWDVPWLSSAIPAHSDSPPASAIEVTILRGDLETAH